MISRPSTYIREHVVLLHCECRSMKDLALARCSCTWSQLGVIRVYLMVFFLIFPVSRLTITLHPMTRHPCNSVNATIECAIEHG